MNPLTSSDVVAVAMLFNPSDNSLSGSIVLPLYYTGLSGRVTISVDEGTPKASTISRDFSVSIAIDFEPRSIHTVVIRNKPTMLKSFSIAKDVGAPVESLAEARAVLGVISDTVELEASPFH